MLQGTNWTVYGQVDFSAYNGGSPYVSTNWTLYEIPLNAFTNDKAGGFKLAKIKSFVLQFAPNDGGGYVLLDDFEEANGNVNTLAAWSDLLAGPASRVAYTPDLAEAAKTGTSGAKIAYTNKDAVKYFNNFTDINSSAVDLTDHARVAFWIRGWTNDARYKKAARIDYVRLEGTNAADYARVPFAGYNLPYGCQIGAFVGNITAANIDSYETSIGKNLAQVMWFINFQAAFPTATCDTVWANGSIPHIAWEPYTTDQMSSILPQIISGMYDTYINNFANAAKSWGKPVLIRWGHEMDGNWYGWGGSLNGGGNLTGYGDPTKPDGPERYVDAYKRVWTIFSNAGATNVKWIWAPGSPWTNAAWNQVQNYWPGDHRVDWMGLSGYNWVYPDASFPGVGYRSFTEIFEHDYEALLRISTSKPIIIAETACAESTMKSNWIRETFGQEIPNRFPQIKAYTWFNINKERDWRVNSNPGPSSLRAMQLAMSDPYYLPARNAAPYGTPALEPYWKHVEIPMEAFNFDRSPDFSFAAVKSFCIEFGTNGSGGAAVHLDEIRTVMTQFAGAEMHIDDIAATSTNAGGSAFFIDDIKLVTTNTAMPRILYNTPTNNQVNVFLTKLIKIGFDKSMDGDSVTENNVFLRPNPGGVRSVMFNATSRTMTIHLGENLRAFTSYTLTFRSGDAGIRDSMGIQLDGNGNKANDGSPVDDYVVRFRTIGGPVGIIWYDDEDGNIPGCKAGTGSFTSGSLGMFNGGFVETCHNEHLPLTYTEQRSGSDAVYMNMTDSGGANYQFGEIYNTGANLQHNLANIRSNGGWLEFWIKGTSGGEHVNINLQLKKTGTNPAQTTLSTYVTVVNNAYRKVEIPLSVIPHAALSDWEAIGIFQMSMGNVNGTYAWYIDDIAIMDPRTDTTPPEITFIHPMSNARATWKDSKLVIQFNETMWRERTEAAIQITPDPGPRSYRWKANRLYVAFSNSLLEGQEYSVRVSGDTETGACDPWGNTLASDYVWNFRVADFPIQPTVVGVDGYRLMMQKRFTDGSLSASQPFRIKGLCHDPFIPGDPEFSRWPHTYVRHAESFKDLNANTLRVYWPWNSENSMPDSFMATNILNELYHQGVYTIMFCHKAENSGQTANLNYTNTINLLKNHPGILMWSWANEPNLPAAWGGDWFGYGSLAGVQAALQRFALAVPNLDPNHPATTGWYEIPLGSDVAAVPALPVWGFTI